jgi:hypothetical protein
MAGNAFQITLEMIPEPARSVARDAGIPPNRLPFWWAAFSLGQQYPIGGGAMSPQSAAKPPVRPKGLAAAPYPTQGEIEALRTPEEPVEGESEEEQGAEGEPQWVAGIIDRAHAFFCDKEVTRAQVEEVLRANKEFKNWTERKESPSMRIIDMTLSSIMEKARLKKVAMAESKFEQ